MYPTSITLTSSVLDEARDMLLLHGAGGYQQIFVRYTCALTPSFTDVLSDPISLSLNPVFTSEEVQANLRLVAQAEGIYFLHSLQAATHILQRCHRDYGTWDCVYSRYV